MRDFAWDIFFESLMEAVCIIINVFPDQISNFIFAYT